MCEWGIDKEINLCGPVERKIKVDACLAPLVQMLNDFGIETIACCCGHGKSPISSIRINSQNVLITPLGKEFSVHLKFPYKGDVA